jgi:hypothetical protein
MESGTISELVSGKNLEAEEDLEGMGETFDSKGGQTKVLIVLFIYAKIVSCKLTALS